ncbi:M20 family metallopeptidase [Bacteroidota bacterium]
MDEVKLTQELLRFNTINPPGNEEPVARYIGTILTEKGFDVQYQGLGKNRLQLIAKKGISEITPPVVFNGHLDVVPLGTKKWIKDPFNGDIIDGKLYGRGASDMKSGVAAMVCAAVQVFDENPPKKGVRLIITAGEEIGCFGARHLDPEKHDIGKASGLIVTEPTANIPVTGHKGGLFMSAKTTGISAHSSMPHEGDNAIYKAARAITKLERYSFNNEMDELLGCPTINVGTIQGGTNFNSVPDSTEFTMDIRTTKKNSNNRILQMIKDLLGNEVFVDAFVNLEPVHTDHTSHFVKVVYEVCRLYGIKTTLPATISYLTDASVLQPLYGNVPTVILGPGQPEMAHKTDEFCYIDKIKQAVTIYKNILLKWEEVK